MSPTALLFIKLLCHSNERVNNLFRMCFMDQVYTMNLLQHNIFMDIIDK